LQERRAITKPPGNAREVKEGEVIILREDGTARCMWKLAHVAEAIKGKEGAVRSARVGLLRGDWRVYLQ